jgi:hypothetical protein
VAVAVAAPEVDDLLAAVVGGDGRAQLAAFPEVALELVAHLLEARRYVTLHHRGGTVPRLPEG